MPKPTVVLIVPGTGEPAAGMLGGVIFELGRLAPGRVETKVIDYPRQYALPMSYGRSRTVGETNLLAVVRDYVTRGYLVVIVGYSQGAVVAGNVAAALSPELAAAVVGVYLVADALRPAGTDSNGATGSRNFNGWGVAGQRPITTVRARWYSIRGDVICDATPDSLVRDIADFSEWMGFTWQDVIAWPGKLLALARNQAWQNAGWWQRFRRDPATLLELAPRGARAVEEIRGYPHLHTRYGDPAWPIPGIRRTYLQQVANHVLYDLDRKAAS
ncbi:cutinase family protein [Tsukamurella ocularis]|uniref:cutinase family protein n=1 Tax=Tsukamurella ocularis TaxID=1970234 RepID=UPI0039EF71D4